MGICHILRFFRVAAPICAVAVILLFAVLVTPMGQARGDSIANVGEAIYRHGVLGSGKPLDATREADMRKSVV